MLDNLGKLCADSWHCALSLQAYQGSTVRHSIAQQLSARAGRCVFYGRLMPFKRRAILGMCSTHLVYKRNVCFELQQHLSHYDFAFVSSCKERCPLQRRSASIDVGSSNLDQDPHQLRVASIYSKVHGCVASTVPVNARAAVFLAQAVQHCL
jgi:hypothetical protein